MINGLDERKKELKNLYNGSKSACDQHRQIERGSMHLIGSEVARDVTHAKRGLTFLSN